MPLGEIVEATLGGALRWFGRVVVELVFEIAIQGSGHLVLKALRPHREPGETAAAIVGLLVWLVLGAGAFWLYRIAA
ncbi:hypothetical protein JR065_09075 [Xanthomonas sp. AmX2]|uniref:hypothetical protein n=1 Tax=Xanthomonas sp. TaxID=29446 RepID=UPI00197EFAB3|nr:hypothetical protein [Xanthomonas sp.]MBN6150492.1 hypothetical protein [Xanthomonas sp.]